jgi:diguanylate cyclase (GGDEF)-like protein
MGTGLGVADTMALIAPKLTYLVPFSACALFIRTDSTDTLRCRFATGTDADLIERLSLRNGNGLTGWIARSRRDLIDRGAAALANADMPTTLQSALVCPLLFGDHFIGMLALYHTDANFYGDDHRRLLDRVCEQAAAVVHNAMVFEQTQEDSLTDSMTGLPNTRFMRTHLTRELARAGRMKSEVSMIVLDLNGFKAINDHHGHHVGDRALREVAHVLRATVRPYDVCVRYAGDEFVVVLSDCGFDEAEDKRRELQQAVEEIAFEPQQGERLPLSISAGTAVFPLDGDTYEALLAEADRKMYVNKSRRPYDRLRESLPADAEPDVTGEAEPKAPTRH